MRQAKARDALWPRAGDVVPAKCDATRAWSDDSRDRAQRGRLAGAVGAYARHHLARLHREVDVTDHLEVAVAGGHTGDLEQRAGRARHLDGVRARKLPNAWDRGGDHRLRDCGRGLDQLRRRLAKVRGDHLLVVANDGRLAARQHLAEVEDIDVVAHAHDKAHVVVDQQHRHAESLADRVQQLREMLRLTGVEACGRLVEQHELRPHRERAAKLHAPLDACGQVSREPVPVAAQVERVQDRAGALGRGALRVVRERKPERVAQRVAASDGVDGEL